MKIEFKGYMERCYGVTIPEGGRFFAFYFDEDITYFDLQKGISEDPNIEWNYFEEDSTLILPNKTLDYIGYTGTPILKREDLGELSLQESQVTYTNLKGEEKTWHFRNFSGDWEQVTFDRTEAAFLFATPYDFDFKYIKLNEEES